MIIVVPMAGRGSRFSDRGTEVPKPFIPVAGRPMVAWAFQSVEAIEYSRAVFITLAEHSGPHGVHRLAESLAGERGQVIELGGVTEGQLCTVLAARDLLNSDEDVLIASADTVVESDLGADINRRRKDCRGLISAARLPGDRWSFAATDEAGWVTRVAEKERISPWASTGLYYFASGMEFLEAADAIIARREKTRGEYYVIPVYQDYIDRGRRVRISEARAAWDMGTPEALRRFEDWLKTRRDWIGNAPDPKSVRRVERT